jgi:hypothetical protein
MLRVQQIVLTILYDPREYEPPAMWEWNRALDMGNTSQVLGSFAGPEREATKEEVEGAQG